MPVQIQVSSNDRLVTLRRNPRAKPPRMILSAFHGWKRVQVTLARYSLKVTHHKHETNWTGGRLKVTHTFTWLGFELLVTRRFPLTSEERAQWTDSRHLANSTSLHHN